MSSDVLNKIDLIYAIKKTTDENKKLERAKEYSGLIWENVTEDEYIEIRDILEKELQNTENDQLKYQLAGSLYRTSTSTPTEQKILADFKILTKAATSAKDDNIADYIYRYAGYRITRENDCKMINEGAALINAAVECLDSNRKTLFFQREMFNYVAGKHNGSDIYYPTAEIKDLVMKKFNEFDQVKFVNINDETSEDEFKLARDNYAIKSNLLSLINPAP